jgi:hypothetical protein
MVGLGAAPPSASFVPKGNCQPFFLAKGRHLAKDARLSLVRVFKPADMLP